MRQWWQTLSARERQLVTVASLVTAVFLVWLGIWRPLEAREAQAQDRLSRLQTELAWLQAAQIEARSLQRVARVRMARPEDQSLLTLVQRSARDNGLGAPLRSGEPIDRSRVRVQFQDASFGGLLRWLSVLQQQEGIGLVSASIEPADLSGQVNASLVLEG